jgi:hypothetical protein
MKHKNRAIEVGTGITSYDLADYNASIITNFSEGTKEFVSFTALENVTAADYWVAVIDEFKKDSMELSIHPIIAKTILPIAGAYAFNIGTTLTDACGALSTATYTTTDTSPGAGRYFVLSAYATEDFFVKALTNCTLINHPKGQLATDYLTAGCHTLLFKVTANTENCDVLFGAVDDAGTPSGISVDGYYVSAEGTQTTFWTKNQCRAIK